MKTTTQLSKKFFSILIFEYENENMAKAIFESLEVDNYNFAKSNLENNKIITKINSKSIPSLIHTLDDYLACVSVAEKTILLLK